MNKYMIFNDQNNFLHIRLLESVQKWLRHGSSTKPPFSLCKGDNTLKKLI